MSRRTMRVPRDSGGRGVQRARALLGTLFCVALIAGCASRDPWEDARIESEVKARLVAEKDANLTRLGVVSRQAEVRLTGLVPTPEQKALAESLAKQVRGVRRVVNDLEVRPETRPTSRSP